MRANQQANTNIQKQTQTYMRANQQANTNIQTNTQTYMRTEVYNHYTTHYTYLFYEAETSLFIKWFAV